MTHINLSTWQYRRMTHNLHTHEAPKLSGLIQISHNGEEVAYRDSDGNYFNVEFRSEIEGDLVHVCAFVNGKPVAVDTLRTKRWFYVPVSNSRLVDGELVERGFFTRAPNVKSLQDATIFLESAVESYCEKGLK